MRNINIIPKNYKGDLRSANGYLWTTLVADGYIADVAKSTPGEELTIGIVACIDMLAAAHGRIAVRDNDQYGRVSDNALEVVEGCDFDEGPKVNIKNAELVATIKPTWSGSYSIFALTDEVTPTSARQVDQAPGNTGSQFCQLCGSYCYGDCEVN